jgi:short-subunit dehydrogenase
MPSLDFAGKLVVVTGASSGLGREIALALALRERAHVVAAARRRDRLEALKSEIESRSDSRVHVVTVDLAAPDGPEVLFSRATSIGQVSALVNCAGVTFYGRTLEAPAETNRRIIAVNQLATMQATMLFLRYFLERREGAILAITSLAALVPAPYQNVYAASKHAVQAFMEGIAGEYRGRGVTLCTFAAASMATEMTRDAGLDRRPGASNAVFLDPARTARIALASFKKGRLVLVPGFLYKFAVFLARITSRRFGVWLSDRIMRSVVHPAP